MTEKFRWMQVNVTVPYTRERIYWDIVLLGKISLSMELPPPSQNRRTCLILASSITLCPKEALSSSVIKCLEHSCGVGLAGKGNCYQGCLTVEEEN